MQENRKYREHKQKSAGSGITAPVLSFPDGYITCKNEKSFMIFKKTVDIMQILNYDANEIDCVRYVLFSTS